jgi:hypothetical protein
MLLAYLTAAPPQVGMTRLNPISRRELIQRLRELGFEGPSLAADTNSWSGVLFA